VPTHFHHDWEASKVQKRYGKYWEKYLKNNAGMAASAVANPELA